VTRVVLALLCVVLTLVVGLWTTFVQSQNRALALELDRRLERCRMLEALNGALKSEILALDWGPATEPGPDEPPADEARLVEVER
jgi:type II secretory pathway pseudopilin PulG